MNTNNFDKEKKRLKTFFKEKKFLDLIKNGTKLLEQVPHDTQINYILGITLIQTQKFLKVELKIILVYY